MSDILTPEQLASVRDRAGHGTATMAIADRNLLLRMLNALLAVVPEGGVSDARVEAVAEWARGHGPDSQLVYHVATDLQRARAVARGILADPRSSDEAKQAALAILGAAAWEGTVPDERVRVKCPDCDGRGENRAAGRLCYFCRGEGKVWATLAEG